MPDPTLIPAQGSRDLSRQSRCHLAPSLDAELSASARLPLPAVSQGRDLAGTRHPHAVGRCP